MMLTWTFVRKVGKPIHVKQNPNPSQREIEEVQERYIEELMK